jgi:hypothetical protein
METLLQRKSVSFFVKSLGVSREDLERPSEPWI